MALGSFFSLFSSDLAIDLGTANTCVYARGKGIVVNEPSIVAINKINGRVEAVGKEAKEMLGRTPGNIVAIKPMKDGVIADFEVTEKIADLLHQRRRTTTQRMRCVPRIIINVPSEITQVEKRCVQDFSAYRAKAGAGAPRRGSDGGGHRGGTADHGTVGKYDRRYRRRDHRNRHQSLAGIVYSKAVRVAGNEMDEAIIQYQEDIRNLLIGEAHRRADQRWRSARRSRSKKKMTMEIKGRHT